MPPSSGKYEEVPIPSYEEAIGSSSRTTTSGQNESSEPAEREGLLGADRIPIPTRRQGYRPPASDQGRDSLEHDAFLGQASARGSIDSEAELEMGRVRGEMEEMDIEDAPVRRDSTWGKRISSLSRSFSSINLWQWRWRWTTPDSFRERWSSLLNLNFNVCLAIARVFAILLVLGVVYLLFVSGVFGRNTGRMTGQMFDPESVRLYVQNTMDSARIQEHLRVVTQNDHVAGTKGDYVLAQYVEKFFLSNGLANVKMDEYEVYLNYPKKDGRQVKLVDAHGGTLWKAKLEENPVYIDGRQQTDVFHGLSKGGSAAGPLIYANYGSREDYKRLYDSGIDTKGAIALVRYYGTQTDRGMKVKAAEEAGFVGCIIYSDPADDGGKPAPDGRGMPKDGVQRGSVALTSWVVGDILTPGWASTPGAERVSKDDSPGLVKIPSLPLSWDDAQHLLKAIEGHGQKAPDEWIGGIPDVEYWSGDHDSPQVNLVNEQDENEKQKIWNVMGQIIGVEQDEKAIIVGNHRDAWAYGATDPGSGTAVMLEVIHMFGDLVSRGWRPLRTIQFASWDAEEYNLIGSTEYVEEHMDRLQADAFAYLNVDVAVGGTDFRADGNPVFRSSLMRVLDRVVDPVKNESLKTVWENKGNQIGGLGAGSDYVAFQDMAGTSSLDFGFDGATHPYHSSYDNFEWMMRVGDPGFIFHNMLGQVWALLLLDLSDRLVLPFDMSAYSSAVTQWSIDLENWVESKGANQAGNPPWSADALREAVLQFANDARKFEQWEMEWDAIVLGGGGFESNVLSAHRQSHNTRMANFETHLLDLEEGGGIPNRTQFKHVLFGPQLWSGYDEAYFPAVRDAVEAGDWAGAQQQLDKAAALITRASKKLVSNLS